MGNIPIIMVEACKVPSLDSLSCLVRVQSALLIGVVVVTACHTMQPDGLLMANAVVEVEQNHCWINMFNTTPNHISLDSEEHIGCFETADLMQSMPKNSRKNGIRLHRFGERAVDAFRFIRDSAPGYNGSGG